MIAGMVAGEGKPPTYNEVSDGWILESGEYGTNDNGNDEKDIKKMLRISVRLHLWRRDGT